MGDSVFKTKQNKTNKTPVLIAIFILIFFASGLIFANFFINRYDNNLSFVAIVKNEGPYIREWIEYHKLVGVDKFYIYDNESTDNLKEILDDYIKSKEVVYEYCPGQGKQLIAYKKAIDNYKTKTKYMGFIDLDEFVIPTNESKLTDVIDDIFKIDKVAGVGINWLMYGSAGLKDKPDGLVIENYRYRADNDFSENIHIKTICNPRKVLGFSNPHQCIYEDGYYCVNEDGKIIEGPFNYDCSYKRLRINHYFTKSESEYVKKKNRGMADRPTGVKRTMQDFYFHDRNEKYDFIMERYVNKLKTILKNEED